MQVSSTQLSPSQLRSLCQRQEQLILAQLNSTRSFDIYAEIAKVCPSQRDLRSLPNEEVSHRLSCLAPIEERPMSSPMAVEQAEADEEAKLEMVEDFMPFEQPGMRNFIEMDEDESMWDSLNME